MRVDAFIKILVSLPVSIKQYLDDLKRLEGVTTSGYIRTQLEEDRQCRIDTGWNPRIGWKALDDPAYQRRMAAAEKRAAKGYEKMTRAYLKRIDKERAAQTDSTRPARKGGRP